MEYYQTRKLLTRNDGYYVCLPKRFLRNLKWKVGDDLLIWKDEKKDIHIRGKIKDVNTVSNRGMMEDIEESSPIGRYEK